LGWRLPSSKSAVEDISPTSFAAELFGIYGAAPYMAAVHANVGLSEELYRELDSMGSQVGVTLVCPPMISKLVAGGI